MRYMQTDVLSNNHFRHVSPACMHLSYNHDKMHHHAPRMFRSVQTAHMVTVPPLCCMHTHTHMDTNTQIHIHICMETKVLPHLCTTNCPKRKKRNQQESQWRLHQLFQCYSQLLTPLFFRNCTTVLICTRTSPLQGSSQVCQVKQDTFVTHHSISSACNLVQVQNS